MPRTPQVKTCHDGKKAGFDANREVWKKGASLPPAEQPRRRHRGLRYRGVRARGAAQAALQALLACNDANLASLLPASADEDLAMPA
jgi:hypothetical protein